MIYGRPAPLPEPRENSWRSAGAVVLVFLAVYGAGIGAVRWRLEQPVEAARISAPDTPVEPVAVVPAPTTPAPPEIVLGRECLPEGARGVTALGLRVVCLQQPWDIAPNWQLR
ncbi:hypothetical protein [Paractinoplanes rishiriensis]|uniref:Uncharacterized protein n=1 Tax=Paractinoplanes rishiriensis TaxID=1050105 RepID=A0A919K1W3_9ACTN|nr:hypothetical protein [Actinoplanes rishiriensis]GIE95081.1 hypothetical protein Ari01nite_25460 [Actinoplanes rishiriensis]